MRLIDADALKKVKFHPLPYTHITPSDCDSEAYKRGWNDAIDAVAENAPTVEPTLYGYNVKHLALIAKVMEEKGIAEDKAVEIFADASEVVQMVLDEQKKAIDAEVKRWIT